MLLVKTYLDKSDLHGFGLFAGEDIKKGTITWKFHPVLDIYIQEDQIDQFPEVVKNFLNEYASYSKISNKYILSADNSRFTNHSDSPNLDTLISGKEPEAMAVANRDIQKGEELTVNYKSFDQMSEKSNKEYLKQNNRSFSNFNH